MRWSFISVTVRGTGCISKTTQKHRTFFVKFSQPIADIVAQTPPCCKCFCGIGWEPVFLRRLVRGNKVGIQQLFCVLVRKNIKKDVSGAVTPLKNCHLQLVDLLICTGSPQHLPDRLGVGKAGVEHPLYHGAQDHRKAGGVVQHEAGLDLIPALLRAVKISQTHQQPGVGGFL